MRAPPQWVIACRKAGPQLASDQDLRSLTSLGTVGSPSDGCPYSHEQLGPDVVIRNGRGGLR
jgi:hypothetical protein